MDRGCHLPLVQLADSSITTRIPITIALVRAAAPPPVLQLTSGNTPPPSVNSYQVLYIEFPDQIYQLGNNGRQERGADNHANHDVSLQGGEILDPGHFAVCKPPQEPPGLR